MKKIAKILSMVMVLSIIFAGFPAVGFAQTDAANGQESRSATQKLYSISTVSQPEVGGNVVVNETTESQGKTVSYTVEPANGYKVDSITIGGKSVVVTDPYNKIKGNFLVEGNTSVSAKFAKLETYKVTTSVNYSSRGSISSDVSLKENASTQIKVKAKSGYYLKSLKVDGVSVGAKYTYDLKNVKKNCTVKAVFSKQKKIMIDAGHYANYNRSPVFKPYYESRAMWDLHEYLKEELLTYNGIQVGVTRTDEEKDRAVYYRGTDGKGYDLLVSLHSNASGSSDTDYPLIITQKGYTNDELAQALGAVIYNTMGTKQDYKVQQRLNRDGATEYYGVLRGAKSVGTKAFIIEHSFHTNYAAAKWLYDQNNLKKMAIAEAAVIADYYGLSKFDENDQTTSDDKVSNDVVPDNKEDSEKEVVASTEKVKVLVSDLNMRKSYSSTSKAMGKAKKNTTYQLKAKTKDGLWGQLKTNGYWIYLKGYTKVVTTTASTNTSTETKVVSSSQKVKVLVSDLNMRKSYSSTSKSMGKAKKNTTYQLKAKTKDGLWGQLKTNGYWIYLKGYTKVVTTSTSTTNSKVVASSQKVKVLVTDLNMRKSYSSSAKSMGKAVKNKTYQLKAKTKDGLWGQLKTNGYWIYLKGYTKVV